MEVDFEGVKEMTFANYDFCEWIEITVFTADIRQTRQHCYEQGRKLADPKQSSEELKPGIFVVIQAG